MKFYFVRHGSTLMNELNKSQGWLNSDLTESGKKELHNIYTDINLPPFDSAYSSDLGRSIDTLNIIRKYITINNLENIFYMKDLRERFLGSYEGSYIDEMELEIAQIKGFDNYSEYQAKNSFADYINHTSELDINGYAEDFATFRNRVMRAFKQIEADALKNNWKNVLIVAHQNSIGLIQHILSETSDPFEKIKLANGKMLTFTHQEGQWTKVILE